MSGHWPAADVCNCCGSPLTGSPVVLFVVISVLPLGPHLPVSHPRICVARLDFSSTSYPPVHQIPASSCCPDRCAASSRGPASRGISGGTQVVGGSEAFFNRADW